MKKVAVFGATGNTGKCILKAALDKGLEVQALVRDPSRVPEEYKGKINIIQGDVLNLEDVKKTINGQDAVIVVLGPSGIGVYLKSWMTNVGGFFFNRDKPPATAITVMSEGMKNIIAAMKEKNVTVVSACMSAFLFMGVDKVPAILQEVNADHQRMYDVLKESGLQWIACLPPRITDQSPTGYMTKHGEDAGPRTISKHDLAQFFVDSISMPEHYQKTVGIASNPKQ